MDTNMLIIFASILSWVLVEATVSVIDNNNNTLWSAQDLQARFGLPLPDDGIWGHVVDTHSDGCVYETLPPAPAYEEKHWIALIVRGHCQFDLKILHAQNRNYYAAIVYNDVGDDLIPMGAGDHSQEVAIPSVFIGRSDAERFKKYLDPTKYTFWLDSQLHPDLWPLMRDFLIIASAAFAFGLFVGLAILGIRWIRDIRRRRRSRLSTANLKKIPIKKFKKGDQYDVCAICLDEFETGDKLRVLPCSHAYHQKCIDPWLTKNKKTCPICKRKVIPGDDNSSDSDDDSDDGGSERAPLLGASANRTSPSRGRGGGTFDNSGLPASTRNQVNPLSLSDSSDDDSYDYSTSNYQSSVDVHVPRTAGNETQGAPVTTITVDDDSDSDETESADSEEELLPEERNATGGVENPALIVIADHFSENGQPAPARASEEDADSLVRTPLSEEDGTVRVAVVESPTSDRCLEQIV